MTNYITWMQNNQKSKDGVVPTQGNPVATTESPASGVASAVAPEGAQYAVVWSDVVTTIQADDLLSVGASANLGNGKSITWPANLPFEVINVVASGTTITMTDV